MNNTIFITGGAGYVGAMLLDVLSRRSDITKIIALDVQPFPEFLNTSGADISKIKFIVANTADNTWQEEVASFNPNIVIHTAWQIREMYGKKKLQWKWNITGSDNVFDFAFSTPSVNRLIHFSTVASYGAFSTNEINHLFTENEPFRKSPYLYAEEKRIAEEHLIERYEKMKKSGRNVQVAVIRPAAITGPRGRFMRIRFGLQSALSGKLKGSFIYNTVSLLVSFVPITHKWCRQFIHEDDIAGVVQTLVFADLKNDFDVFNACPPGPVVTGKDMADAVGKKTIYVHPYIIRIVFFFMWNLTLGKIPTSKGGWKSYSYPIAVDGSKLTKMYNYKYGWQSKEAFVTKEGFYSKYVV
jgi:nucleoside-diphosphate-sugar epimerase